MRIAHVCRIALHDFDFVADIGEVAFAVGGAVVLQDSGNGVVQPAVYAVVVVNAVNVHPCDGLACVFGNIDVVVGYRIGYRGTDAVLEVLCQGVAEHGSETESRDKYSGCVDAEVLFQQAQHLTEEDVVLVVVTAPDVGTGIAFSTGRDKDVVAFGVQFLLAVVRRI